MDELDAVILEAAQSLDGDSDVSCADVLEVVGGDQTEVYARMVRLMDPVWLWFPLLEGIGNFGDRDVEPMWPPYVRCRIGPVGQAALGDPDHPALLANGDLYRGGTCAPYAPSAVTAALRQAADAPAALDPAAGAAAERGETGDVADSAQPVALGLPAFPTGCHVDAAPERARAGELMAITVRADICATAGDGDHVVLLVRALPPGAGAWSMMSAVANRERTRNEPMFCRVEEVSGPGFDHVSRWVLADSAAESMARTLIEQAPGVVQTLSVEPAPRAADRLMRWVADHGRDEALRVAHELDGPFQPNDDKLARRTSPTSGG